MVAEGGGEVTGVKREHRDERRQQNGWGGSGITRVSPAPTALLLKRTITRRITFGGSSE